MTTRTKARRKPRSDALAAIHETAEGFIALASWIGKPCASSTPCA